MLNGPLSHVDPSGFTEEPADAVVSPGGFLITPEPSDIGVTQGTAELALDTAKSLVLNALTFGGYGTWQLGKAIWAGYQEDRYIGALNAVNPLYQIARGGADSYMAAERGNYRAAGAAGVKTVVLGLAAGVGIAQGVRTLAGSGATGAAGGTGAFFPGAQGGAGLGKLAGRSIRVSEKGLGIVARHLMKFPHVPENAAMVARLRQALTRGSRINGADASFYLHEVSEATMMARGLSYEPAHAAALAKYSVSPFSVYHPEVIAANPGAFNSNWFKFWGITR